MKRFDLLAAIALVFGAMASTARADSCTTAALRCLEAGTMVVAGVTVANGCTSLERDENCTRSNPVNSCATLADAAQNASNPLANGQCRQVTSDANTCTRMVNGVCDSWYRTYQCWNGPASVSGATLESRQFRNLTETFPSDCARLTSDANCKFEATRITEGFQSRVVNELDVSRAWWAREHDYDCTSSTYEETCGNYAANPICQPTGELRCLGYAPDGSCEYEEVKYHCQADASFTAQCEGVEVCVGDNCLGVEAEPSQDYPKAAAWLNFLDEAAKENKCRALAPGETVTEVIPAPPKPSYCSNYEGQTYRCGRDNDCQYWPPELIPAECKVTDQTVTRTGEDIPADQGATIGSEDCAAGKFDAGHLEPAVFKGEFKQCMRNWVNCCSEYAYSALCSAEDAALKDAEKAGVTHYLETKCNGWFLGICVSREQNYCVYDSKFARVFQQQADVQTQSQLNSGCPALTIEQMEGIDVNQMDLSEVFGDMLDQTTKPVQELVIDRLSTQMGVFRTDVQEAFE